MNKLIFLLYWLTRATQALDLSQCIGPLGLESGAIADSALSASSSFEDSTVGPHNARIRVDQNGGAWCPKNMVAKEGKEWLEIDLGSPHAISATESQGRFGNGQGVEYTESYMLEYYRPRLAKWVRYRSREGQEIIDANGNTYVAVKRELNPVILASRIRFLPYSNFKRTVCMRVEVYGCSMDAGLLSYSMPQGDRRGNAYEFYDWTYDGEWKGNTLLNGLGCLADGDYGPENFKLSYYAQSRGLVGWKRSADREMIEILFDFDAVREFHQVHIFTNNQFSHDVSVFKEMKVFFSIGGEIFDSTEPVSHIPMEDTIFEEPRNVTAKLHRRTAKFVKLQLFFASKWIMISEVNFDTTLARGNYTPEVASVEQPETTTQEIAKAEDTQVANIPSSTSNSESDDSTFMPIIIGVLTVVILFLAAIIFFIVKRTRQKKWLSVQMHDDVIANETLAAEKLALNGFTENGNYPFKGFLTATSDSSGHSSTQRPKLDDNYNTPHVIMTPRPIRSPPAFYSVSRNGSIQSHISLATPKGGRKTLPPLPRLHVPPPPPEEEEEAVYTEPGPPYTELYQAMRYSPYYAYGPVLSEIEDSLMKQSLLSDTSCGDYAVPLPRASAAANHHEQRARTVNNISAMSPSNMKRRKQQQQRGRDVDSISSQHSGCSSNNAEMSTIAAAPCQTKKQSPSSTTSSDSLRVMRARLETHVVPELTGNQLSLRQRLSEGAFGTVYIADARGLPDYGVEKKEEDKLKKLVAVKFLAESATAAEKAEFVREVRLLSVLEDVNISRVLGMCSTQDPYLVAMEYLENGDLCQFLRCHLPESANTQNVSSEVRTLSFGTLIHMASQVASGMRYLESLNFVHRDLATRNCLVGKAYHLKICDFGSDNPVYARDYFEMEGSHLLVPIRWMAWESVLMCKYTTKSDVWSFGVCLWEILNLASVRPFVSLTDDSKVLAQLQLMQTSGRMNERLERPAMCPKDLYELMCECWKREETSRPSFRKIHLFLQRKNLGYSPL